jgi:hypothetical protein
MALTAKTDRKDAALFPLRIQSDNDSDRSTLRNQDINFAAAS